MRFRFLKASVKFPGLRTSLYSPSLLEFKARSFKTTAGGKRNALFSDCSAYNWSEFYRKQEGRGSLLLVSGIRTSRSVFLVNKGDT